MSNTVNLLDALLESWERNNTIMLNLLRTVPQGGLQVRAMPDSPTVAQQFAHVHHERLVSVAEEVPECAIDVPNNEWMVVDDRDRIAQMLNNSARVVRDAVKGRIEAGRELDLNYGHPLLMIQLLLWHEGYHHGQIKLALKMAGQPIGNDDAGPITWDVWRKRM
jgi:DinB family protein